MKSNPHIRLIQFLLCCLLIPMAAPAAGNDPDPQGRRPKGPPPEIVAACQGLPENSPCQVRTPDGVFQGTCVEIQGQSACVLRRQDAPADMQSQWETLDRNHDGFLDVNEMRPDANQPPQRRDDEDKDRHDHQRSDRRELQGPGPQASGDQGYSITQAVSDKAQLGTIAFDALAFLTGDFAADTFLPPGKVSDYFGFQYMRDIDAAKGGHNTSFLTRIANNMLAILHDGQKAKLLALAKAQETDIRRFAQMRFPLIAAFRRNLEGELPAGSKGLDKKAVVAYSSDLYALDGRLSFQRAKVMAGILRSLDERQKAALARLRFGDSSTWPEVADSPDKRRLPNAADVAVMTYASEMFAWYAGSREADTYFCPERHGMYFGGFGLKTAPAMGRKDYSISTSLTGDSGEAFLGVLNDAQRKQITNLVDLQRRDLDEIVRTRRAISTELRRFLDGGSADQGKVLSLAKRYGELDGEISFLYATAFANVGQSLTARQKASLAAMRSPASSAAKGPFLYSSPIRMPDVGDTDFLFGP